MRSIVAGGLLGLALLGSAIASPTAAASTTVVSFTGESGTLAGGSGQNARVAAEARRTGNRGLVLSASGAPSSVRWGVPSGYRYAAVRLWVRVLSRGAGESVDLITIQNTQGTAHFDLFVNGRNQRLMWDLHRSNADSTSTALVYGRWYRVEALVEFDGSDHTAQVRVDGVDQGTIRSSGRTSAVRQVIVGSATAKTHTQHYDDITVRLGLPRAWIS